MRAQEADAGGLASGDTHDLRGIIAAQVSRPLFSVCLSPLSLFTPPRVSLSFSTPIPPGSLFPSPAPSFFALPRCERVMGEGQAKEIEYLKGMGSLGSHSSSGRTSGMGKVRFDPASVADMNPSASAPVTPTSSARGSHPTDLDAPDYAGLSLIFLSWCAYGCMHIRRALEGVQV